MNELDELIDGYRAQGYNYTEASRRAKQYQYHHKRNLVQKAVRDAVNQLKVVDPAKFAEIMFQVEHAAEHEAAQQEKQRLEREEQKRLEDLKHFKFRNGVVVASLPNLDFSGVEGMIAFRTWNITRRNRVSSYLQGTGGSGLFLGSTAMSSVWSSIMIADRIPAEGNDSGLYCIKLDPLGLITKAASYLGEVCGLLELRGKVLEHTDGVVRAEWARIICVFIQANEKTENVYSELQQSYPTVPLYVLHKEQVAEILLRVTMMQSMGKTR